MVSLESLLLKSLIDTFEQRWHVVTVDIKRGFLKGKRTRGSRAHCQNGKLNSIILSNSLIKDTYHTSTKQRLGSRHIYSAWFNYHWSDMPFLPSHRVSSLVGCRMKLDITQRCYRETHTWPWNIPCASSHYCAYGFYLGITISDLSSSYSSTSP
jgi:hypothetical protein